MNIAQVLEIIALLAFLAAVVSWPPGQQLRAIGLGLFLWVLAILISK